MTTGRPPTGPPRRRRGLGRLATRVRRSVLLTTGARENAREAVWEDVVRATQRRQVAAALEVATSRTVRPR